MKKLLLVIAAAFVSTAAFAQFEVGVGYVNGTYKIDPDAGSAQSNSGSGFYLGGAYNFDLTELGVGYLSFEPGLQWVYNHVDDNGYDFKEHFINVPLMFNYNYPIASDVTLIGYAGPTLSFGVSCKDDNDIDYYDDYLSNSM